MALYVFIYVTGLACLYLFPPTIHVLNALLSTTCAVLLIVEISKPLGFEASDYRSTYLKRVLSTNRPADNHFWGIFNWLAIVGLSVFMTLNNWLASIILATVLFLAGWSLVTLMHLYALRERMGYESHLVPVDLYALGASLNPYSESVDVSMVRLTLPMYLLSFMLGPKVLAASIFVQIAGHLLQVRTVTPIAILLGHRFERIEEDWRTIKLATGYFSTMSLIVNQEGELPRDWFAWSDTVRLAESDNWQLVVDRFTRQAPFVVVDCSDWTPFVDEELGILVGNGAIHKTFFLAGAQLESQFQARFRELGVNGFPVMMKTAEEISECIARYRKETFGEDDIGENALWKVLVSRKR